jgi:hypothetical protein
VGILFDLAPWITYWVLVGNVPFSVAGWVALAIAVAGLVIGRGAAPGERILEIGSVGTFLVLAALTLVRNQSFMEQWMLPLSNTGIFLVSLIGVLIGKSFVREFAAAGQPAGVVNSDLFDQITARLIWIWVIVFAGMTVSSSIPPILQGFGGKAATILDARTPQSFVCYWVIPFSLLGLAVLTSRILLDRMAGGARDVVRKTTFVAYGEATIDELYYLATEHASREVGAGQEAFDVKVGSMGTPLVGDDTRQSWPSTYKVRESRR